MPKLAAREKSRTGNSSSPTTKREATIPELAAEPAAKTATGETEKMDKLRIAPNVEVRGWRSQSLSNARLDASTATERSKEKDAKLPHEKLAMRGARAGAIKKSAKR